MNDYLIQAIIGSHDMTRRLENEGMNIHDLVKSPAWKLQSFCIFLAAPVLMSNRLLPDYSNR